MAFGPISIAIIGGSCARTGEHNSDLSSVAPTTGAGASAPETTTSGSAGASVDFGDAGNCTPLTCSAAGANCGPVADGCGAIVQCGTCPAGTTCGGSGQPSVCGTPPCSPKTCADQSTFCGPAGDGCGNLLDCGSCPNGTTCGGGGPGTCGTLTSCTPTTCAAQGFNCGPTGDGCGNLLECGTCAPPAACGGGGIPGVCGAPSCNAMACADFGPNACGLLADGCGGLLQCGGCSLPSTCGAITPNVCGIPTSCTNLCLLQQSCPNGGTTTVSGTVYAPNGIDPLPNVLVYVPNAAVQPFTPGVSCDNCASSVSGSPLVSTATDPEGKFSLSNVPVGSNIPLVIQTGRWRRQVTLASVVACQNNQTLDGSLRLPRNKSEGDIPHMAFATGKVDSLECVLRKIGVQDSEFTTPSGSGRIHIYTGSGAAGANAGTGTPSEVQLWSQTTIDQYDMVLFPCQGSQYDKPTLAQQSIINYANSGGRIFATHYSYVWLYNDAPFSGTALWDVKQPDPTDQTGFIDTSFPKGVALADWLQYVGASTAYGQIPIQVLRRDLDGLVPPSQRWMYIQTPNVVMHYTFNTPVGAAPDQQCGRVLFDDFHVENATNDTGLTFPNECDSTPMTPQEKLLEFMIFDLGSCVAPDVPQCTPTTCAAQNIGCGLTGDGCGNVIDCGSCPTGETCGGGGTPSQCGSPTCTPITCATQGIQCGPAGDGCGNLIECGPCPTGETCGGGGMPGICGTGTCTPISCAQQGIQCGPAGDGCGNLLDCGPCPTGETCGGGGTPGQCGSVCAPKTCAELGFDCGPAGDGCGGLLDCGTCSPPLTCGGGGTPNVCGGSIPK